MWAAVKAVRMAAEWVDVRVVLMAVAKAVLKAAERVDQLAAVWDTN